MLSDQVPWPRHYAQVLAYYIQVDATAQYLCLVCAERHVFADISGLHTHTHTHTHARTHTHTHTRTHPHTHTPTHPGGRENGNDALGGRYLIFLLLRLIIVCVCVCVCVLCVHLNEDVRARPRFFLK